MALSRRVAETLLDLVEIKLSLMEVHDREDNREAANLESCIQELKSLMSLGAAAASDSAVAAFAKRGKGRRRATA